MAQEQVVRVDADRAQAELLALKAQINPHFLFNTLNGIYTLALTNSPATAESIMKLSNIMRYITDDAGEDFVALKDDVNCINNYISLQRLRLGDKIKICFEVAGDLEGKLVAPLLLMTFVENIFKNGISKHEAAPVTIRLNVSDEAIRLFCQNRIFANHNKVDRLGIGIANTRKRLEHAYPNSHQLSVNTDNGFYTVNLELKSQCR